MALTYDRPTQEETTRGSAVAGLSLLCVHQMLHVVKLLNGQDKLGTLTTQLQAVMIATSKASSGHSRG